MQLTSIKPPSAHVQQTFGATLAPLGVEIVDAKDLSAVELRFKDPKDTEVANAAFQDSLDGVKLVFRDKDGNGVRGLAGGYDVLDGIGKLAGVTGIGAFETMPLQGEITVDSEATAAVLKQLLRPVAADGTGLGVKVDDSAPTTPPPVPAGPGPSLEEAELGGSPAPGVPNGPE